MRSRKMLAPLTLGLVLAYGLGLAAAAPAQTEGEASPAAEAEAAIAANPFAESLEVSLVGLDVVVTDRQGNPVTGLDEGDFELSIDGKRGRKLPITHFRAVEGELAAEPLLLVLFVDNFNLREASRNRALEQIQPDLEAALAEGASIMVLAFGEQLDVMQPLTEDPELLRATLRRLALRPASDARIDSRDRQVSQSVMQTLQQLRGSARDQRNAQIAIGNLVAELRVAAQNERADVDRTLDALGATVSSLSGVPGRKALLYLSEGLAMRPYDKSVTALQARTVSGNPADSGDDLMARGAPDSTTALSGASQEAMATGGRNTTMELNRLNESVGPFDATERFTALAGMANTRRITFYPMIAVPGDAEAAGSREVGGGGGFDVSDRREGLEKLAELTAGRANTAAVSLVDWVGEVVDDLGTYYSLAFEPPDLPDGTYVPLAVDVRGRGYRARYRQGFVTSSFESRLGDRVVAAMTLGFDQNPIGLEAVLKQQSDRGDGTWEVQVQIAFPIGGLELVETATGFQANARVAATALDSRGRLYVVRHMEVPLVIPADQVEAAREQYYAALVPYELPAGSQQVAIGLWDQVSGQGSFVVEEITVGE